MNPAKAANPKARLPISTPVPFGWHLNVRAPDNIAVELLVRKPEVSAMLQT